MPELQIIIHDEEGLCTARIEADLLHDCRLDICVLQTIAPDLVTIRENRSRPAAVAVLRDLLQPVSQRHGVRLLDELMPGRRPLIVVAPEYAFGFEDFEAVDALVRGVDQPLVLIAGFGASPGKMISSWLAAELEGDSRREATWDQASAPISNFRAVNGAWCWVHNFECPTTCLVYLKNHLEQSTEAVELATLQEGRTILRLAFRDIDIFPMICADLVQTRAEGERTAQRRVERLIASETATARPILVVGSILQEKPANVNWAIALDGWLNTVTLNRPTLTLLANVAVDRPVQDEEHDRWRSFSGVFGRFTAMPRNQQNLPVARTLNFQNVTGAVVRSTRPCLCAGSLAWPDYRPTGEMFYWHAQVAALLTPVGIEVPLERPPPPLEHEVVRLVRREPPQKDWCPRVAAGLAQIRSQLETGSPPDAVQLIQSILNGIASPLSVDADRLHESPIRPALRKGLHAVATLSSAVELEWQSSPEQVGQLRVAVNGINVLVWRDPNRTGKQISHALGAWLNESGPHPPLAVIVEGAHGTVPEGVQKGHPRDDVTAPPTSVAAVGISGTLGDVVDDFTKARTRRRVACIRLERVEDVYVDYEAAQDQARMAVLVAALLQPFAAAV